MKPWVPIASARTPDGTLIELLRHDTDYLIRAGGLELMSSRMHSSEDAMMQLAYDRAPYDARVLVGGLGMGFTTAAALAVLSPRASVLVAELLPAVIDWNRGPLGSLANHPLDDPRTTVVATDVATILASACDEFDAILLDVDNGPSALTDGSNSRLYSAAGLALARRALRPGGALVVWSVSDEPSFAQRMQAAGLEPTRHVVAGHRKRGPRHVIFVGRRT